MSSYVSNFKISSVAAVAIVALVSSPAFAGKKLYSPYVEQGELEIEYFNATTVDKDSDSHNKNKHLVALAYGITDWWKSEIYAEFEKDPQENTEFEAWEWENIFQLTERGEYAVDVGALLAYEYKTEDHNDKVEGALLLAKDIGKTFHVLNAGLEQEIGASEREDLEGYLLWSSRYNLNPMFEPGFEVSLDFGALEHTGHFDDQNHQAGPMAYGRIPMSFVKESDALKYRVGYMFGLTEGAVDGESIVQLEYEIHL